MLARQPFFIPVLLCALAACEEGGSGDAASSPSASASVASLDDVLAKVSGSGITIESVYDGEVGPLEVVKSARQAKEGAWQEVPAKYTKAGWTAVKSAKVSSPDYEEAYAAAWKAFLGDVQIAKPKDHDAQVDLLDGLTETPVPYLNLLTTVANHTVRLEGLADDSPIRTTFAPLIELTKDGDDPSVMTVWLEIANDAEAHIRKGKTEKLIIKLEPFQERAKVLLAKRVPEDVRPIVGPWLLHPLGATP